MIINEDDKISLDSIASSLIKHNFILTALELHTELAEIGRELPRLRDFFSNPSNFEQYSTFPLHKTPSIQTFDSLDLTRYSDDTCDLNNKTEDKITLLEFELRKAKETINQLRHTLTKTTENETTLITPLKEKITRKEEEEDDDFINEQILLPHDKNSINFLINEYLLQQNYKMTSVTFSEENESLNLEDWDEIGLNKAKPPSIINLFKSTTSKVVTKDQLLSNKDFSQQINFDENLIDLKIEEIEKLNEKQKLLLNKIEEMSLEIENLNGEREILIKRIDSISSKTKKEEEQEEKIEYEKFKFER